MNKTTLMLAALAVTSTSMAQTWAEAGDAGQLPAGAQVTMGVGMLSTITGELTASDADMYAIMITDSNLFFAQSHSNSTTIDTQMWLFNSAGMGISFNDDWVGGTTLQSAITDQFVNSNGLYYLAISGYDYDATSGGNEIWLDTPFRSERMPDGAGAAGMVDGWGTTGTPAAGLYEINLRGAEFATVPEPGTMVAIGLGLAGLALARRRK